jgi:hypothetical protein
VEKFHDSFARTSSRQLGRFASPGDSRHRHRWCAGLKGAAAGLIAAAAPKAIGAGIGTLLAGGNLGDAALNAVGFGAAGAAGSALSGGLSGTPGVGAAAPALGGAAPAAAVPPTVPTDAAASALDMQGLSRSAQQIAQALGGGQQQAAPQMMQAPTTQGQPRSRASDNPMLASMFEPPASPRWLPRRPPLSPLWGVPR